MIKCMCYCDDTLMSYGIPTLTKRVLPFELHQNLVWGSMLTIIYTNPRAVHQLQFLFVRPRVSAIEIVLPSFVFVTSILVTFKSEKYER